MSVLNPPRSLKEFRDILREKHNQSDFLFMSRTWNPVSAYKHIHKTNPTKIKRDVFCSAPVQHAIEEVCFYLSINIYFIVRQISQYCHRNTISLFTSK